MARANRSLRTLPREADDERVDIEIVDCAVTSALLMLQLGNMAAYACGLVSASTNGSMSKAFTNPSQFMSPRVDTNVASGSAERVPFGENPSIEGSPKPSCA